MGRDTVERVIGCEHAFGIDISDAAAARMRTPRHVREFVLGFPRKAD